jgi:hypothetical protein
MKLLIVLCSFFISTLLSLTVKPVQIFADGSCLTLNNGGSTTRQICPPTPTPSQASIQISTQTNNQQQNDGGQKVYPSSNSKTTPNTGPDDWSLPILLLIAGVGFFLRKKSYRHNSNF